jgi:hypothetical protein
MSTLLSRAESSAAISVDESNRLLEAEIGPLLNPVEGVQAKKDEIEKLKEHVVRELVNERIARSKP